MRKLLVPPIRFRPESEGGAAGRGGPADRAYLHAHSQMLMKVIQKNISLGEALLESQGKTSQILNKKKEGDKNSGSATQKWI